MRRRYRYDKATGKLVEVPADSPEKRGVLVNKDSMFDNGVQSMVDGQHYYSRAAYNEHLKRHCMVELGNDILPHSTPEPQSAIPDLARTLSRMGHGA